jgi:hypothetical protein
VRLRRALRRARPSRGSDDLPDGERRIPTGYPVLAGRFTVGTAEAAWRGRRRGGRRLSTTSYRLVKAKTTFELQ